MSTPNSVIDAFDKLSREDRQEVLNAITTRLSPYEWRDLQDVLAKRTFQRDFIGDGEMPLEIVMLIFSYLPLNAAFTYQRVSKAWQYKINSSEVFSAMLARSNDRLFSTPTIYENKENKVDELRLYKTKAERLFRLQYAIPKRVVQFHIPYQGIGGGSRRGLPPMDLFNSTLIWEPEDERSFHSLNLETGKLNTVEFPGKVVGNVVCTTGDYVLVDTATNVYAYDIRAYAEPPIRLRKPHGGWDASWMDHVCMFVFAPNIDHTPREVVVWDLRQKQSTTFMLCPTTGQDRCNYCHKEDVDFHNLMRVWINSKSELLLFFFTCFPAQCDYVCLRIIQTDFKGKVLFDINLQFQLYHGEASRPDIEDAAYASEFYNPEGSDIVHISVGMSPIVTSDYGPSICFEIDSGASPPIIPGKTEFWLCAHPLTKLVSRQFRYEGVSESFVKPDPDDTPTAEHESPKAICHTYVDPQYSDQEYEVKGYAANQVLEMIEGQSRVMQRRYHGESYLNQQEVTGGWAGTLFYYAVDLPFTPSNISHAAEFEVYPTERLLDDVPPTVRKALQIKVEKHLTEQHPEDSWTYVRMQKVMLTDAFAVVQVIVQRASDHGDVQSLEMVYVVLAFDPDYQVPDWSDEVRKHLVIL